MNYIYGINAVTEALKARGRAFQWVGMAKERHDIRLQRMIEACRRLGVPVKFLTRTELDQMAGRAAHQGVVAVTSAKQYSDLDDVVGAKRGQYSFVIVLDGVEDPHNLGALMRTADAAGADGVVIPERRAAAVTGTVTKVSAGASEHLPIAKVTNISRTVEDLKTKNLWIVGLDERGMQTYDSVDYKMDCAIALGAEGKGLHDLVRKRCDFVVSIPMLGKVPSLNVSVAAGIVLYEVEQQRLAVRGKLTLRNDSASAQKNISLQVSSTLDWRSIQVSGKPVQFVTQPYTSDIDHTGALSEAIVTLPQAVPPKGTIELDIGYEGTIP